MKQFLTLCIALLLSASLWAGTVDARFSNAHYQDNKYIVDVQVRAADITFELGSATVFFNYNTTAIAHPTFASLNFNETNTCAAGNVVAPYKNGFTYLERNELGEGNYSITLMMPNMGCPTVTNEWIDVARFTFDVLNPTATPALAFSHQYTAFNTVDNTGTYLNIGSLQNIEGITGIGTANPNMGGVSVSPTVTNNLVNVVCNLAKTSNISINVYDLIGKTLYSTQKMGVNGTYTTNLDLSKIAQTTGYYLVEVDNGVGKTSQKILFVK